MGVKFVTGADASNAIAEQTDKAITLFTLLEIILRSSTALSKAHSLDPLTPPHKQAGGHPRLGARVDRDVHVREHVHLWHSGEGRVGECARLHVARPLHPRVLP